MPYDDKGIHITDKQQFDRIRTQRVSTGRSYDQVGNVFQAHRQVSANTQRDARRRTRAGYGVEKPWRSRVMRGRSMDPRAYTEGGLRVLPVVRFLNG